MQEKIINQTPKVVSLSPKQMRDLLFGFTYIGEIISIAQTLPQIKQTDSALYRYKGKFYIHLFFTKKTTSAQRECFKVGSSLIELTTEGICPDADAKMILTKGECLIVHNALTLLGGTTERAE